MYTFIPASASQPGIRALIAALDAYQAELYPAESNHLLDLASLPPERVIMQAIVDVSGAMIGCGAIVLNDDGSGEMKRVYIDARHRGQQLGEKLLAALEHAALDRECHTLRLETGIKQHSAVRLYSRSGYQQRGPFAPYAEDPLSIFMEKRLTADRRLAVQ